MNKMVKAFGAGALAIAAAAASGFAGAQAWESMHLPRWAWIWELQALAQETSDQVEALQGQQTLTLYQLMTLNRSATENDIDSLRVQIDGYQKSHQIAPPILIKSLEEKQHRLDDINKQLDALTIAAATNTTK